MHKEADAKLLHSTVDNILRGGVSHSAGIFGPFGMNRGLREELLKESGIISGKIASSTLNDDDLDQFFGLCQVSQANGLMSESDLKRIAEILERSTTNGSNS